MASITENLLGKKDMKKKLIAISVMLAVSGSALAA